MIRLVALVSLVGLLAVPMLAAGGVQTNSPDKAEWLVRFNTIRAGDWRTARSEVAQLAGLPPGKSTPFISSLWPDLTVFEVKKELLSALFDAEQPDALRIARIAIADTAPQVREAVRALLMLRLGLIFGQDDDKTRQWIEAHQNRPYGVIRRDRVREVVEQLRTIGKLGESDRSGFLRQAQEIWRTKELHDTIVKGGLFNVARDVLRDPAAAPDVRVEILRILTTIPPSERYLRETVWPIVRSKDMRVREQALLTLANARYRPAYNEIKIVLIEEHHAAEPPHNMQMAQALASYGDPEAIPFLIGLIAADNAETIYDVGYFALGQLLTGAPYSATHDGNWWRIWWERNRVQLPASVRDLPIPDFAHSLAYKEPIPREAHLDRARLRDLLLQQFTASLQQGREPGATFATVQTLAQLGDPAAIPMFIGAIAADNSTEAINYYGSYGLTPLTGVPEGIVHDGNWWRLWWEAHRGELPAGIRDTPLPNFPRAKWYRDPIPVETHRSPDAMRIELLARLRKAIADSSSELTGLCRAFTALKDPSVVPDVIDLIPQDPEHQSIYWLTYFGIGPLTGVPYSPGRGRAWWQNWWSKNGSEFRKRLTEAPGQPDFLTASYKSRRRDTVPLVTEVGYAPRISPAGDSNQPKPDDDDIKDVSSERFFAKGDKNKLYRLVGLSKEITVPPSGYKLLVLLPGGDGSEEFRWFVRRIKKFALPADMLVAQLVAPQWSPWQARNMVWPTRKSPFFGMKFPTEQFVDDVIADVGKKTRIDPVGVYTFAWSSSGPAVYTHAATSKTSIRGAFIGMSVFRPAELPDPAALKDRRFYLYHSPQDFIPIKMAKEAAEFLTAHGAQVKMQEYQGGHGWSGNVYEDIQQGIAWMGAGN